MLPKFSTIRPSSITNALAVLDEKGGRLHAGGTDLIGCLRDGVLSAETLVSLGAIEDLKGVAATSGGGLRLGAMTTIAEIAGDDAVNARFTALADAARVVASPQLRNQGTIGGNLCQKSRCWYYRGDFHCLRKGGELCYAYAGENQLHCIFGGELCFMVHPSDTAPALAALGATCRISGPSGDRSVPVEKLHVPPAVDPQRETVLEDDEIITEIVLPKEASGLRSSYRKVRSRNAWDFAVAGVALALVFDGDTVRSARVFLSGAAPVPWHASGVEKAVVGKVLDADTIAAAAAAAVEGAEPLSGNAYKIELFKGLVTEQLEAISG
ncbi:MAG: xanthine dehydrogenase family protein subunit M [Thermoanaerobaculales bacterium]|jgi:xanthine dehydrogenase YagS FAD-binding subunit|nr:xanthine dehydrogenase family protein subunit M [Thermoanaerobaculales bacterium]